MASPSGVDGLAGGALLSLVVGFVGALFADTGTASGFDSGFTSGTGLGAASDFCSDGTVAAFGSLDEAGNVGALSAAVDVSFGVG